eukprot:scaffold1638_cov258-Pinguiococcus_pyrenoidosus.AAC.73
MPTRRPIDRIGAYVTPLFRGNTRVARRRKAAFVSVAPGARAAPRASLQILILLTMVMRALYMLAFFGLASAVRRDSHHIHRGGRRVQVQ